MKRFIVGWSTAAILIGAVALPALAVTGPNPYPAVSQPVCESYGGTFFGSGNLKECDVTTNVQVFQFVGYGHGDKSGKGWTIDRVESITYTIDTGDRTTLVLFSDVTCINPGGKTVTNDWIKPCQPY
jgi:hypothetical protein